MYGSMCQVCHLGPGIDATPVHAGLTPQPPRLSEAAKEYSPERLFWIVKHGIKMSGMPAWGETHPDKELWNVVAFLQRLPQLGPQEYQALTQKTSMAHSQTQD
jgi:mono/diheme cytochrome c family protein